VTASIELRSASPEDTRAIGARLGAALRPGDVVSLTGELGAGKTCLVQGAAAALGVAERVTSPSFILRKDYQGAVPVLHLDVYRLQTLQDVLDIGWEEALDRTRVAFVEWGDAMSPLLPEDHLEIDLRVDVDDGAAEPGWERRAIGLRPRGHDWTRRLADLADALGEWRV
jgi:tRNA threonylcarbamoyladenosine biosynthesis protein TsaE